MLPRPLFPALGTDMMSRAILQHKMKIRLRKSGKLSMVKGKSRKSLNLRTYLSSRTDPVKCYP